MAGIWAKPEFLVIRNDGNRRVTNSEAFLGPKARSENWMAGMLPTPEKLDLPSSTRGRIHHRHVGGT